MNVWKAMQQELMNLYQFLYHVIPVVIFQLKNWSDSAFTWSFQVSSFLIKSAFLKDFRTSCMISKLSPIEVWLFQRKKWPQNRKVLLFGVRVANSKIVFLYGFLMLKIPDPCRNPDFIKFLPVIHFHTMQEHAVQI